MMLRRTTWCASECVEGEESEGEEGGRRRAGDFFSAAEQSEKGTVGLHCTAHSSAQTYLHTLTHHHIPHRLYCPLSFLLPIFIFLLPSFSSVHA